MIRLPVVAVVMSKMRNISSLIVQNTKMRDNHYCVLWATFIRLHWIHYYLEMVGLIVTIILQFKLQCKNISLTLKGLRSIPCHYTKCTSLSISSSSSHSLLFLLLLSLKKICMCYLCLMTILYVAFCKERAVIMLFQLTPNPISSL